MIDIIVSLIIFWEALSVGANNLTIHFKVFALIILTIFGYFPFVSVIGEEDYSV